MKLQQSSEANEAQKTSPGEGSCLAGTGRRDRARSPSRDHAAGGHDRSSNRRGGRGDGVHGAVGIATAGVADNRRSRHDGLDNGAGAVRDDKRGGLGDGIGLGSVCELGGARAVGGVDVDNLGDNRGVARIAGRDADSCGEREGDGGELHLEDV